MALMNFVLLTLAVSAEEVGQHMVLLSQRLQSLFVDTEDIFPPLPLIFCPSECNLLFILSQHTYFIPNIRVDPNLLTLTFSMNNWCTQHANFFPSGSKIFRPHSAVELEHRILAIAFSFSSSPNHLYTCLLYTSPSPRDTR